MSGPATITAVVPSHGRPLRLLWLLNSMEEQTLDRSEWELLVVHDYDSATAQRVFDSHPLRADGTLRHIAMPEGTITYAPHKRNVGWRAARGRLVAFTDDDCRPEPDWLERLLEAAGRNPAGIVQGLTRPDPLESRVLAAPHVRTMNVKPVTAWAQTCNILYPRELIERAGGFDEDALTGEDVGLALRAQQLGARMDPAPDAVVNHAVESHQLPGIMRENLKWRHLAYLAKEQPEVRAEFPLGIFWDTEHMRTTAALAGIAGARRHPALLALALPYVRRALRRRGRHLRGRAIAAAELPGQLAKQGAEVLGLVAGSVRHRTLLL